MGEDLEWANRCGWRPAKYGRIVYWVADESGNRREVSEEEFEFFVKAHLTEEDKKNLIEKI